MTANVLEEWVTTPDGTQMYAKLWKVNTETPLATVVFIHGFGEHINRYNHMFDKFTAAGLEVYGWDQRGFGRTAQKNKDHGVNGGWKVALADITEALRKQKREGVPIFLMGHSMGGGLALNYAATGEDRNMLAGVIASAPLISQPPEFKTPEPVLFLGSSLSRLLPSFQIPVNIEVNHISRDPEEVAKYSADPLVHGVGSLRLISDMMYGGRALLKERHQDIRMPILLTHGSADKITCHRATKEFFDKLTCEDKTYREWEGGFHELHNDLEKDKVIDEYIQWIKSRAAKADNGFERVAG